MTRPIIAAIMLLTACRADLPDGWDEAVAVDDFTQDECDDTGGTPPDVEATMDAYEDEPGVRVMGEDLSFRCSQDVEGFYKSDGESVEVLVQPVNMNPRSVTKCDCSYHVEAGIPEEAPIKVSLYRRGDHYGGDDPATNLPTLIGTIEVP